MSTYHPAAYALVSDSTDKQKGTQLGNFEFWGALGIFIMFLLYGALLQKINWRGILYVTAFPGIIIGYCFLKIFPRPGKEKQSHFSSSPRETGSSLSLGVQILFFLALALRILSITAIVNFALLISLKKTSSVVLVVLRGNVCYFISRQVSRLFFTFPFYTMDFCSYHSYHADSRLCAERSSFYWKVAGQDLCLSRTTFSLLFILKGKGRFLV